MVGHVEVRIICEPRGERADYILASKYMLA